MLSLALSMWLNAIGIVMRHIDLMQASCDRDNARTVWALPADGVIADGLSLLKIGIDVPAFTGGRYLNPGWSSVDADGVGLANALSIADALTNVCACLKANPTDTTGVNTVSGDGAASVVSSPAALAAANLDQVCLDKVYQFTGGSTGSVFTINGQTGDTDPASILAWVRKTAGSGTTNMQLGAVGAVEITGSSFTRLVSENLTPTAVDLLTFSVAIGDTVEMILPNSVKDAFAPVTPIIGDTDTAAAKTRDADICTLPSSVSVVSQTEGAIRFKYTPSHDHITLVSSGSYIDADNNAAIYNSDANTIRFLNVYNTLAKFVDFSYTPAVSQAMIIDMAWDAGKLYLSVYDDGDAQPAFQETVETNPKSLGLFIEIGSLNGSNVADGEYANDGYPIHWKNKEAAGWS